MGRGSQRPPACAGCGSIAVRWQSLLWGAVHQLRLLGVGLVASLAKPGGNATGVTNLNMELFKKCFELMHSLMPQGATIAVLVNPANVPQTASEGATVQDAARALGARVVI